jgi:hypothetical protein
VNVVRPPRSTVRSELLDRAPPSISDGDPSAAVTGTVPGLTTVTTESASALPTDKFIEAVTIRRGWYKRKLGKALSRMQSILEEDMDRGARATVAGL